MRYSSTVRFTIAALTLSVLLVSGCRSAMGPKMPPEMSAPAVSSYSKSQFDMDVKAYRDAVKIGDLSSASTAQSLRNQRNQIAYRVMADIESSYSKFEMHLTSSRATQETLSSATVLGMTAATGLVGANDVKDILAATSSAFQGSWQSYDKNFFREKTTESIVSQMRASRKTKQAQLITNLATRNVADYPWDAVWIDLIDFYYAGTVPSALVEIASSTGAKAEAASADLNATIAQQAKQAISVRSAYQKLSAAVNGSDKGKAASALAALKFILTEIGRKPADNATADELLAAFRDAMSKADLDADPTGNNLKALNAAIAAANL